MKTIDFAKYRETEMDSLINKIHLHNNCYEIIQVIKGKGSIVIGQNRYPYTPGGVYIIKAFLLHSSCVREQPYIRSKLSINASCIDEILNHLDLNEYFAPLLQQNNGVYLPLSPQIANQVDELLKHLAECFESQDMESDAVGLSLLLNLLTFLRTEYNSGVRSPPLPNTPISRVIKYINLNISEQLTLDTIAKSNNISKFYLCKLFKKEQGISIMNFILNQRLMLVKNQLRVTSLSCSDIAMAIGFSNFSSFCQQFKKKEGMTPSEYRRKHQSPVE